MTDKEQMAAQIEEAYAQLQAIEEKQRTLEQRKLEAQNIYHDLTSQASDLRASEKRDKGRLAQIENNPPVAGIGVVGIV